MPTDTMPQRQLFGKRKFNYWDLKMLRLQKRKKKPFWVMGKPEEIWNKTKQNQAKNDLIHIQSHLWKEEEEEEASTSNLI